ISINDSMCGLLSSRNMSFPDRGLASLWLGNAKTIAWSRKIWGKNGAGTKSDKPYKSHAIPRRCARYDTPKNIGNVSCASISDLRLPRIKEGTTWVPSLPLIIKLRSQLHPMELPQLRHL